MLGEGIKEFEVHQMPEKLMPCPHCGGATCRIRVAEMVSSPGFFYIGCRSRDCGAVTSFHASTWKEAVERWNRRAASCDGRGLRLPTDANGTPIEVGDTVEIDTGDARGKVFMLAVDPVINDDEKGGDVHYLLDHSRWRVLDGSVAQ